MAKVLIVSWKKTNIGIILLSRKKMFVQNPFGMRRAEKEGLPVTLVKTSELKVPKIFKNRMKLDPTFENCCRCATDDFSIRLLKGRV